MSFLGLVVAGEQAWEHSGVGGGAGIGDESETKPAKGAHPELLEDRRMGVTASHEHQVVVNEMRRGHARCPKALIRSRGGKVSDGTGKGPCGRPLGT